MSTSFPEDPQFSVSELNRAVRALLEAGFSRIAVEGELSNLAQPSSGHLYFTLKDAGAQIRCAMFRGRNRSLRFRPDPGQQVIARGQLSLYEARGDYQLIVDRLEPAGNGALQQAFEALQRRLQAEGLFAEDRKQPLPPFPTRIAVITSATGAAIRDILAVLQRRAPHIEVLVIPVSVQGELAPDQIVRALAQANERQNTLDLVVVGRGGGSLEDLWCFNDERVARAIAGSALPVVSAVGHETDVTISDLVADLRAPTPSAAAEIISQTAESLCSHLADMERRLVGAIRQRLHRGDERLAALKRHLRHPGDRLRQWIQQVDELELRLRRAIDHRLEVARVRLGRTEARLAGHHPEQRLALARVQMTTLNRRLHASPALWLQQRNARLNTTMHTLDAVGPLATLGRGYAIVHRQGSAEPLRDPSHLQPGERIVARLQHGSVEADVLGPSTKDPFQWSASRDDASPKEDGA
ncbi:MAG: exodeoxyribonuclease VII large subunit [Pseudomonadota bacterium]|nr:exodeoxyribonuclease VII large subunit [Pseudomonadota bacterium]